MNCQCVDATCSTAHENGCTNRAEYFVRLNRIPSTHKIPIPMCVQCAQLAELCCDAIIVGAIKQEKGFNY